MDLVEIDPVDAHSRQGRIDGLGQIVCAAIIGDARPDAALGGDDHALPQFRGVRQYLAEQRFGRSETGGCVAAIDVRRVEQGDAGVQRRLHPGAGLGDILAGQAPHAPGDRKDGNAALA